MVRSQITFLAQHFHYYLTEERAYSAILVYRFINRILYVYTKSVSFISIKN
jgi:hypothetical protein